MQLKYIRYFIYLAFNWNLRIAFHIISQEIKGEKKYRINSTGADELKALQKAGTDTSHATLYMPASYDLLEKLFSWLQPFKLEHFTDIGCGKGRVMCVAALYHFKKVSGIDFSKDLLTVAAKNLEETKKIHPSFNYQLIHGDAAFFEIPADTDCIFFFNPFDEVILKEVVKHINKSFASNPRDLYIIYINPLQKSLFLSAGFEEIFNTTQLVLLEACILKRPALPGQIN